MHLVKRSLTALLFLLTGCMGSSFGQQVPDNPVSYRIFDPFIYNPAMTGSKDYFAIDLIAGKFGGSNSQLLSGNARLSRTQSKYSSSTTIPEFTNIGIGGYLFNDYTGTSRNAGAAASMSYHLKIDREALSYVSFGISAKAVFNRYYGNSDLGEPAQNTFFPNFDAGVYYYSPHFFAGISATNLLGTPADKDTADSYTVNASRQLFLTAGYKIMLSKPLNIVIEPSLIINTDDSFSAKITDMIQPVVKLYAGNIFLGTYFNDFHKTSIFFKYKYKAAYIGTFFELKNGSPFYKTPLLAEAVLGLNISAVKSGISRQNHW